MPAKDVIVVLAHGESTWARVISVLKAEGVKVSAAPLLPTSLADDVAALNRSLDRTEGPIVLAGHAGEKVADVFYRLEPHTQAVKRAADSNGLSWLPEGAFATAFAQDASTEDRAMLAAVQRPISLDCISVPAGRPFWKDIPSWFLIAAHDRMIVPETQRFMAQRRRRCMPSITHKDYDRLDPEHFFSEYGFTPTTTYELAWEKRHYQLKAIAGTAYEFATGS